MGEKQYGIDMDRVVQYAKDIKEVHKKGIEIALVIGRRQYLPGIKC